MRILVPGALFEDSFVENVYDTLKDMGHEVFTLPFQKHSVRFAIPHVVARTLINYAAGARPRPEDVRVLKLARQFRPEILLVLTDDVHPEILRTIRQEHGTRRVLWWGDAPANNTRLGLVNPEWDAVFVKDAEAVERLRIVGSNAHLLHEAMNPRWHRVIVSRQHGDIVIAGTYYAFRQALILRLMRDGIGMRLYGSRPPRWCPPEITARWTGRYITRDEKSRIFGEGLACLNSFSLSEGNSVNCRAFEIAGAGGLQIIQYRPAVESCFEPGAEILAFKTYDELLDAIRRVQSDPAAFDSVRAAGARRALAEHTYRHRLDVILRTISS